MYSDIKATEVPFSALNCYLRSFYSRITKLKTGGIQRNTLYSLYHSTTPYCDKNVSCTSLVSSYLAVGALRVAESKTDTETIGDINSMTGTTTTKIITK